MQRLEIVKGSVNFKRASGWCELVVTPLNSSKSNTLNNEVGAVGVYRYLDRW